MPGVTLETRVLYMPWDSPHKRLAIRGRSDGNIIHLFPPGRPRILPDDPKILAEEGFYATPEEAEGKPPCNSTLTPSNRSGAA